MSASTRLNILLDLSGTLHIGDVATPAAIPALRKLRDFLSKRGNSSLRFASNTTKEAPLSLQQRLLRAGFGAEDVPLMDLYTSLSATAREVAVMQRPALLLLSPSAQQIFQDPSSSSPSPSPSPSSSSATHFRPCSDRLPKDLDEEEWKCLKRCNVVVVGLAPDLMRSEWLDEAFRILSGEYSSEQQGAATPKIIATHRASYYRPANAAPLSMGPGPYVSALETAARLDVRDTLVCGKPSRGFFEGALKEMRGGEDAQPGERNIVLHQLLQKKKLADVSADLGEGAIELGLERILVKTGKYRHGDEDRATKPVFAVHETFAQWVDVLISEEGH
ncbi:Predicted sugar phosphatase (HAD superfamily) [Ceraceosorus bombacis]|uniref:Predicted sugar phosphatase (HAD superfamily) n=1 Tax=Ceraceosorus bombacis TaxID=401625 RepID=A0A0P1BTE9_9BASI|nr:Predicted sugar phosphatase (HAD superfamily) [Ceraceosorus bombacis]